MSKSITIGLVEILNQNFGNLDKIKVDKNMLTFPGNIRIDS
jgi:hypothetical protein